jgi:hypothetical protein
VIKPAAPAPMTACWANVDGVRLPKWTHRSAITHHRHRMLRSARHNHCAPTPSAERPHTYDSMRSFEHFFYAFQLLTPSHGQFLCRAVQLLVSSTVSTLSA